MEDHNRKVCNDLLKATEYYKGIEAQYKKMSIEELRTAYTNPNNKQWEKELITYIGKQKTGKI